MESSNNFRKPFFKNQRHNNFSKPYNKKPQQYGYISNFEIPEEFNGIFKALEEKKKEFHSYENQNQMPENLEMFDDNDFIFRTTKDVNINKTIMDNRIRSRESWLSPITEKRDNINVKIATTVVISNEEKEKLTSKVKILKNTMIDENYEEKKKEIFKLENIANIDINEFINVVFAPRFSIFTPLHIKLYTEYCENFKKSRKYLLKFFNGLFNKMITGDEEIYNKYSAVKDPEFIIANIFYALVEYKIFDKKTFAKFINLMIDNFNYVYNALIIRALFIQQIEKVVKTAFSDVENEDINIVKEFFLNDKLINIFDYKEITEFKDKIKKSLSSIKVMRIKLSLMDIEDVYKKAVKNGTIVEKKEDIKVEKEKPAKIISEWDSFKTTIITENSNSKTISTISTSCKTTTINNTEERQYNRNCQNNRGRRTYRNNKNYHNNRYYNNSTNNNNNNENY